ncbi:hypothetical protein ACFYOY_28195 [Streptomyces sp. NPDC007875]|uniref:hypothetical protein n=1 Tax=Streptomyces sp. NPDC007875 TaxID=3364783 RepID=UPI003698F25D
MRITWRLVLGFLAVSVLALLAALTSPSWPQGRVADGGSGAGAPTVSPATVRGAAPCTRRAATPREPARRAGPGDTVCFENNRCEKVDNMCVMAEGPNDGEGDGRGTTSDFTIRGNHCETLRASQALMFEDVQNATITGNEFAAPTDHAIGLARHSTGARVDGNTLHSGIRYEVGIDDSSRAGYRGPEPGRLP